MVRSNVPRLVNLEGQNGSVLATLGKEPRKLIRDPSGCAGEVAVVADSRRMILALLVVLSLPLVGAKRDRDSPGIVLRARPQASIAPGGRLQPILVSAEIVGPEDERYYCPEIVWLLPNGRSAAESDCDPFAEREHYPRHFKRWVLSAPKKQNYEVCVELRKAGAQFDGACVRYLVR